MSQYFSSDFTLGILGGGQLGKMLLSETQKWDIKTHVLDPSNEAPSRFGCHLFTQGSLMDYDTVVNFGKDLDMVTIEIEGVNTDALETLEKMGVTTYPKAQTLRCIQDKGLQKTFYKNHQIPTSDFDLYDSKSALLSAYGNGGVRFPRVWKSTMGGYDGNGVKVIRNDADLEGLPEGPCLMEDLVPFSMELAVIVARSPSGAVASYPVVEMEFHPEANQVEYVICPARISQELALKAQNIAQTVTAALDHVGLLAVELFVTPENDILVNEVAPRPHNSGHYSIEASNTNQFEMHLRAIMDLPLGNTNSKVGGVMVNLVGSEGHQGPVVYKNMEAILAMPGVTPHIYGKSTTRPFRKMGHVTIVDPDIDEARRVAETVKKTIQVISK